MIDGKAVIGFCVTKIFDLCRSELVDQLHLAAKEADMKLIVFNSFSDFFYRNKHEDGEQYVYDAIQYDVVDALVIHEHSFFHKELVHDLATRARQAGKPVVIVNGEREGCFSVNGDYRNAFCEVLSHVLVHHGVQDTMFMGGHPEGDQITEQRLDCYKQVLWENGLPFTNEQVLYGELWSEPAYAAMTKMMASRTRPPQAIFCANDEMARSVCDWLLAHGWNVPRDVIVTGYDGLPNAELFTPELTTCSENAAGMAQCIIQAVKAGMAGQKPGEFLNPYLPIISESCGCERHYKGDYRELAKAQYQTIRDMEVHETQMFVWLNRIFHISDMNGLYQTISGSILSNSYFCLRSDYVANAIDHKRSCRTVDPDGEMVVIPSLKNKDGAQANSIMPLRQQLPYLQRWMMDDTMFVLTAVHVMDVPVGYYAVETDCIKRCMHNLKRMQSMLNTAFNVSVNHLREMDLQRSVENAAKTNPVTKLPNLKGAVEWYENFRQEHSGDKCVSVSVYGMPKYTYISENYGVKEAEEAQRFVAECLRLANTGDCYIAHVADDLFIVLNYYNESSEIAQRIDTTTSAFYTQIESFNKQSTKEYFIEVNSGCTEVEKGFSTSLESLIKFANSDMYINRLKRGMGKAVKEQESPREYYRAFEMLVDKNLFLYHFQPIISARTGEIFGYEALMRTDSSIGLNPLEILAAAKEYGRLYDIERATLFNVMDQFQNRREQFGDKKVFINIIPGHFLNEQDMGELLSRHGAYMDRFVFELTEQESMPDSDLNKLRRFGGVNGATQIAVDDFGTGHSNIVNVLRYAPQVIKIDRFLVKDIHKSQNKQLFVRNVVEFAKMNGIQTLAEGVETSNELHQLIDLGIDLIQGYYTGRPQPELMTKLPEDIRHEILQANPTFAQQSMLH